jgi:hypothetical protein
MRNVTAEETEVLSGLFAGVEQTGQPAPWPLCLDCKETPETVWLSTEDISTVFTEARHVVHMHFLPCDHVFRMTLDPAKGYVRRE